jgi:hypothetical protein
LIGFDEGLPDDLDAALVSLRRCATPADDIFSQARCAAGIREEMYIRTRLHQSLWEHPMVRARIEISTLHCTEQYDEHGNSEPYMWFAYFFTDAMRLTDPEPITVVVPNAADIRGLFPVVGNNQDITIPTELGTFEVDLEDAGLGIAMLGVLVVLLEEDDTPSNAVAAGHDAFEKALRRELNKFFSEGGLRAPDDVEMGRIVGAVTSSVTEAVTSELGLFSQLCDDQDDTIGFAKAIFFGGALKEPLTPTNTVFELPAIDADALKLVITSFNPLQYHLTKVGHNHYEFVRPLLRLQRVIRPVCGGQVDQVKDFAAKLKALRDELNGLKTQLAQGKAEGKSTIQKSIENLKKSQIPAAQKELEVALSALRDCHVRATQVGAVT